MRPGKVLLWKAVDVLSFFPQKRKNQIRQLTDPAVPSSVNEYCCGQGTANRRSQCRNFRTVTEGLSGQWFNVYWSFFSFPGSRPLPGEIRQHMPALRAGKGVHFVAEELTVAGANSRARKCLPVVLPDVQGKGPVRQKEVLLLSWSFGYFWIKPKVTALAATELYDVHIAATLHLQSSKLKHYGFFYYSLLLFYFI